MSDKLEANRKPRWVKKAFRMQMDDSKRGQKLIDFSYNWDAVKECNDPLIFKTLGLFAARMLELIKEATGVDYYRATPTADPGWQDMESAPRDGTEVLLSYAQSKSRIIARWLSGGWDDGDYKSFMPDSYFSHWRPLPPPPQEVE